MNTFPARSWEVLLIGGASGVGKTSVSYQIARHFGIGITEIDDFQVLLETMTTPEQQPLLHYWNTHPEAIHLPPEKIVDHMIAISRVMSVGLNAVIANHLESAQPIVLEGDFMLPPLAVQPTYADQPNNGRVRAVFIHEPDEDQIVRNYLAREPDAGAQNGRARVSWLYARYLAQEADRVGVAVVPARPWDTLFDRLLHALT